MQNKPALGKVKEVREIKIRQLSDLAEIEELTMGQWIVLSLACGRDEDGECVLFSLGR